MQEKTAERLRDLIEEIEGLEMERAEKALTIKEVYQRAAAEGFDAKIMRKLIMMRRKLADEVEAEKALLDLYVQVVGLRGGVPDFGTDQWVSKHAQTAGSA